MKEKITQLNFCNVRESLDMVTPMQKICSPLLTLGIKSFVHVRLQYKTQNLRLFSNKKRLLVTIYENPRKSSCLIYNLVKIAEEQNLPSHNFNIKYLWHTDMQDEFLRKTIEFDFCNVFSISHYTNEVFESACFGTHHENMSIVNSYLNNVSTLQKFISYYKNTTENLIAFSDKPKLERADRVVPETSFSQQTDKNSDSYLKFGFELSKRQWECLQHLSTGKSAKEIGNSLEISCRTVESYITIIKAKLGIKSTKELIDYFWKVKNS